MHQSVHSVVLRLTVCIALLSVTRCHAAFGHDSRRNFSRISSRKAGGGDQQYIHGNDQESRQELLNSVFGPSSARAFIDAGIATKSEDRGETKTNDQPKRVLEIGCGAGVTTQMLAGMLPEGSHITGIDTSADMIAAAKRRFADGESDSSSSQSSDCGVDISFLVQSGEDFAKELSEMDEKYTERREGEIPVRIQNPEHAHLFDAVWIRFVLVHVPDPMALLRAACSCLKPGGTLLVEDVDALGCTSDPPLFGMDLFHRCHRVVSSSLGGDLERGRKVGGYLRNLAMEGSGNGSGSGSGSDDETNVNASVNEDPSSSPPRPSPSAVMMDDIRLLRSYVPLFGRGVAIDDPVLGGDESNRQVQEDRYLSSIALIDQSLSSLAPALASKGVASEDDVDRARESLRVAASPSTLYQTFTVAGGTVYQWTATRIQ